ncbi:MAG: bacillithiol biosynthesis BshC, partial [Planctomycetes bacterium]|nr:bacillithiol biosynthesis BshC [Planctomycetota bacterium]
MNINLNLVPDELKKYHPYTSAYREPGSERYRDFSEISPFAPESLPAFAEGMDWHGDREGLSVAVREYLVSIDAPAESLANADKLADPKTVCIVAGHQPALFGGPLFLLFKLASAIKICRQLSGKSEYTFVPD